MAKTQGEKIDEIHEVVIRMDERQIAMKAWQDKHEKKHEKAKDKTSGRIWDFLKLVIAAILGALGVIGVKEGM